MKTILSSRRYHYMAIVGIFLITLALIGGMVGCAGECEGYTLIITSTAGGMVTTPGEAIFCYDRGTVVSLNATPNACHRFVEWTGDVGTITDVNAAATNVTMSGNYSITANFELEQAECIFADFRLEAAVRDAIGINQGPIYRSDLLGLTSLNATGDPGWMVHNLTGLECAINLEKLNLTINQISNISMLANFTSLTELHLGVYNHISNISPLSNLTSLTCLDLSGGWISDISALSNLTSLTELHLGGNQISNISPLSNLTSLEWLNLSDNDISDINALVQNQGLGTGDWVDLRANQLSSDALNTHIPQLQARGVTVSY